MEDGDKQVHITGPTREKIMSGVEGENHVIDMFDEALEDVMRELFVNLFAEFKEAGTFVEACQGIIVCVDLNN